MHALSRMHIWVRGRPTKQNQSTPCHWSRVDKKGWRIQPHARMRTLPCAPAVRTLKRQMHSARSPPGVQDCGTKSSSAGREQYAATPPTAKPLALEYEAPPACNACKHHDGRVRWPACGLSAVRAELRESGGESQRSSFARLQLARCNPVAVAMRLPLAH